MDFEYLKMGERIAHRRKQLGIKQNVLAERISVSNNHLSSIERGQTTPSLETFINICNELKVTPDFLLLGTMNTQNLPKNIFDGLQLCSEDDLALISMIVQYMINRNCDCWNDTHFSPLQP